jgi:hypothetical protein
MERRSSEPYFLGRERRRALYSGIYASETAAMTTLEFIVAFSIMPVGALIIAGVILFLSRYDGRDSKPGE